MIALLALAKTTSLSVIVPTPLLITLILTPSTFILRSAFLTASSLPLTSVLRTILISFLPSFICSNISSKLNALWANFFPLSASFLFIATLLASFSLSNAMNLSPATGTSSIPVTSTGLDGSADTISLPVSSLKVLTFPENDPTTIGSPNLKVPFCINNVTTGPIFLSSLASITEPIAYLWGFAFKSNPSESKLILSSSSSIPCPVWALIFTNIVSPPQDSGVRPNSLISLIIFSILMFGLSILLTATIIGTPAALAWSTASLVWGITPSSAATTIIAISVTDAPRALIAVNASWPGVSKKVIFLPWISFW